MNFPVIIRDRLFSQHLIRAAVAEWPSHDWPHWHLYDSHEQRKYASKAAVGFGPATQLLLSQMSTQPVPCPQSFPDLYLHGAGLSMIRPGGFIGRHVDAVRHPLRGWERVASMVLFLTSCGGGRLLIDGQQPMTPQPGRMVVMDSNQPHEVSPVASGSRLSLNLFWWRESTGDAPDGQTRAQFFPQPHPKKSTRHA